MTIEAAIEERAKQCVGDSVSSDAPVEETIAVHLQAVREETALECAELLLDQAEKSPTRLTILDGVRAIRERFGLEKP